MNLHVSMTPEDYVAGRRRDCGMCPLANTIQRAVRKLGPEYYFHVAHVKWGYAVVYDGASAFRKLPSGNTWSWKLPEYALDFIEEYDDGKKPSILPPFTLEAGMGFAPGERPVDLGLH